MTANTFALAATIILLFPMLYFMLASPTFLLAKLEDPTVTWLLRGLFNTYFLALAVVCALGAMAHAVAGRPLVAIGLALVALLSVAARRWFLGNLDAALSARDSGDTAALRRLRGLHWGGMAYNLVQFGAIVASVQHIFAPA